MDEFVRSLRQRVPNNYIQIPDEINEWQNQEWFLSQVSNDLDLNPSYFRTIFKKILNKQEVDNFEINDDFYSIYIDSLMPSIDLSPLDYDYLTYQVSSDVSITIKENPNLISGLNTTGLRTWELSIYLSYYLLHEYLPQNPEISSVLELGTGTGLVGLALNKYQINNDNNLQKIFMTDGDSQLIENLSSNFSRNEIPMKNCFQYIWGDDLSNNIEFDLCIGADITYDISILPPLVETFTKMFANNKTKKVVIACTIRNESTLLDFEKLLLLQSFKYRCLEIIPVDTMFINEDSKFKVFEITPI